MEGLAQAARALEPHHQHALLQPLELEQHMLLGRAVEVEARPRYASFARDLGHVGPVEADPAEIGDGGLEQALPGGVDLALTAPGQGGRKGHEPFLAWILTPVNSTLHMSGSSSIPSAGKELDRTRASWADSIGDPSWPTPTTRREGSIWFSVRAAPSL